MKNYFDLENATIKLRRTAHGYITPEGRFMINRTSACASRNGYYKTAWDVIRTLDNKVLSRLEETLRDAKLVVIFELASEAENSSK